MFQRGEGYYRSGNVTNLEYDRYTAAITADLEGNYGDYCVRVSEENGMIRANCDCHYDGYPCKHMAAVMLEFAENKSKYIKKMAKSKRQDRSLESKVSKLSKEELVEMVMDWSRKYSDLKSELMVRFAEDKQQAIASIRKQMDRAFTEPGNSYSITQIARRLRTLAKQGDSTSHDMKADIYWAIADRTLKELNEYGISDETLLVKYEDKLAPIYPNEYVGQYEEIVTRYIENRGRENYRSAVQYAERIKRLYRDVLKDPEVWKTYIQELRATNKNLPGMQDEFGRL